MSRIFESPDRGQTVYSREFGSDHRELQSESPVIRYQNRTLEELKLWGNIHRAAVNDPALQELLDQVKSYYILKNIP
jgi:hypothetical protein